MVKNKRVKNLLIFFAVIGLITSTYLTYIHYQPSADIFCEELGGGCDIASGSMYSTVDGILNNFGVYVNLPIPVAVLGIIAFIFIILMVKLIEYSHEEEHFNKLFYSVLVFLIFSAYLTYGEFIVLKTFCIYCDIVKLVLLIIFFILCYYKFNR